MINKVHSITKSHQISKRGRKTTVLLTLRKKRRGEARGCGQQRGAGVTNRGGGEGENIRNPLR